MSERYRVCALCGQEILDHKKSSVARQMVGWILPSRTGGGQIVARRETGALAHVSCAKIGKAQKEGQLNQGKLW